MTLYVGEQLSVCALEAKSLFWVVLVTMIFMALNKTNSHNILQLCVVIYGVSCLCSVFFTIDKSFRSKFGR